MKRFLIAAVCCLAVGVILARENLKRLEGVHLDGVAAVGGELKAGKEQGSGWLFRKTPQGVLIFLSPGERAGAWGGWYLNYDQRGKDPRVGLVPQVGPGCYWTWEEGPRKRNVGGFGYTFPCTARPANGPLRGWKLTADGDKLTLARDPGGEITFKGEIDDLDDGK
jgi:hypothetical protein